ncbi:MAG: two-component system response regulator [Pleurocapsa sp.]
MNHRAIFNCHSKTVLIVNNNEVNLASNSAILTSLQQVFLSVSEAHKAISWVQQHQPDLIILDLEWSQIVQIQLITALRLDWLTRNIPIMLIVNSTVQELCTNAQLNYDACLVKPYSTQDLERKICSLVSIPACELYVQAV